MKRIVICMDGTWQTLSQDNLTNIGLIARSVAHKETIRDETGAAKDYIHQTVIYTHGVGSTIGALSRRSFMGEAAARFNRLAGGAFGEGLEDGIVDTYLRLAFNYEMGDEIFIFGFSRGAFAARRLAGLINTAGIVSRRHVDKAWMAYRLYHDSPGRRASDAERQAHAEEALQFRRLYGKGGRNADGTRFTVDEPPQIKFLGVFDTVIQRGFGDVIASLSPWGRRRYEFRNLHVCPNVQAARHAVAVDEQRMAFPPTLWEGLEEANARARQRPGADPDKTYYQQRWFVGTHGDVGGGVGSRLAALTLKWMAEGAAAEGLRFYGSYGDDLSPMDETLREAGLCFDAPITRPKGLKVFLPINFPSVGRRIWREKRRTPTPQDFDALIDSTVAQRALARELRYNPSSLRPFRKILREHPPQHPNG
ncbi:MAG: DUF2235 domain-containing protein [Hyphomonadaceae bacterium]|nr:DUF2235 domain-containing protein [Hyphomonadaceae bacterium]MBX3511160.1 DUF2235 domain-containing protein [Hyphomonadaceae bacterium]